MDFFLNRIFISYLSIKILFDLDTTNNDEAKESLLNETPQTEFEGNDDSIEEQNLNDDQNNEPDEEGPPLARFFFRENCQMLCKFIAFHLRPRRVSELNIVEKVKPIPPHSSLFIFEHTNQ